MKLSNFKFTLPPELIAKYPTEDRDDARLLIYHQKEDKIEHKVFKDLTDYFSDGDVMVFNDTKVFPARLYGIKEKTGAQIEVFLLRELDEEKRYWDVIVDPARKIRIGNKIFFGENDELVAEVIDNTTSRGRTLRFLFEGEYKDFKKLLYELGEPPLPKFLGRPVEEEDDERYQTIFSKHVGAVAAPMAGAHFSRELLKRLEINGIDFSYLTLHLSLSQFRKIDVEDLSKHKIESESLVVSKEACEIVNRAVDKKKQVCAVGTSVLKGVETVILTNGHIAPYEGWTNKFIFPPFESQVATCMLSNFHFPYSIMLMAVSAFGGHEKVMSLYQTAIKEKYRFGPYGDGMLII